MSEDLNSKIIEMQDFINDIRTVSMGIDALVEESSIKDEARKEQNVYISEPAKLVLVMMMQKILNNWLIEDYVDDLLSEIKDLKMEE